MLDLSSVARERAVLATVANVIVAAAAGRGLRVTVACPDAQMALVDHLAQALHARGRACHCQVSTSNPSSALGVLGDETDSTLMVLTSGAFGQTDDVQRVTIRVTGAAPLARAGDANHRQTGEPQPDADREPDILLDYHDPDGPTIRHIAPHLAPPG